MSRKPLIGPRDEIIVQNLFPRTEEFVAERLVQTLSVFIGTVFLMMGLVARLMDWDLWWLFFVACFASVAACLWLLARLHRNRTGR